MNDIIQKSISKYLIVSMRRRIGWWERYISRCTLHSCHCSNKTMR